MIIPTMNSSEQTISRIERALRKAASKFPSDADSYPLTDLYIQVRQESGELMIFDDDDTELTRCVVEEWIGNADETFYDDIQPLLRKILSRMDEELHALPLLKPFSFVLIGEDKETLSDLYLVDDETIMISGDLMEGLGEDLDQFWEELSKK